MGVMLFTAILGIGLIVAACIGLAFAPKEGEYIGYRYDEKTGQVVDQDSAWGPFFLFLILWAVIVFYMVFDGFSGRGLL